MTEPSRQSPPATTDLMRAVASAYRRLRRASALEHEAWEAARDTVLEQRPDLDRHQAAEMATRIIAWAAQQHGDWLWRGVGGRA